MVAGAQSFVNRIEFKDYHKFEVESTVRFGGPEGADEPRRADAPSAGSSGESSHAAGAEKMPVEPAASSTAQEERAEKTRAGAAASGDQAQKAPLAEGSETAPIAGTPMATASAHEGATAGTDPGTELGADGTVHLRINADLVLVPVVVRDRDGNAVSNLSRDDFEVFDKGRRQEIVSFSVLGASAGVSGNPTSRGGNANSGGAIAGAREEGSGTSYIVFLFDDLHLSGEEMARAKDAVRHGVEAMAATDRAAVITISGQAVTPMTDDRRKLVEAVTKLHAQPGEAGGGCPQISYYMANEMVSETGPTKAMGVATAETIGCMNLAAGQARQAAEAAMQTARSIAAAGEQRSRASLVQLRELVRWLAKAPGNRSILLVSPGFVLNTLAQVDAGSVVEEAIRNQVVISVLDVRGVLGANAGGAIDEKSYDASVSRDKAALARQEISATEDTMGGIAEGTGGTFARNTNDLDGSMRRLVTVPACTYVLGFRPEHLKTDGSYHALEVKVAAGDKVRVQSRPGYFAPRQ
jgi:VWFA-related protein